MQEHSEGVCPREGVIREIIDRETNLPALLAERDRLREALEPMATKPLEELASSLNLAGCTDAFGQFYADANALTVVTALLNVLRRDRARAALKHTTTTT